MDLLGGEDITISIKAFFILHRGGYERSHALMALLLRHAGTFIGHFQRMVKNRSRQMLGLLTQKLPENNLLTLMFTVRSEKWHKIQRDLAITK